MHAPILDGLATVARAHLNHDGPLPLEASLVDLLRLDSIRLLTLVVEVENHFQICLEDGDQQDLVTVGDLARLVERRIAG